MLQSTKFLELRYTKEVSKNLAKLIEDKIDIYNSVYAVVSKKYKRQEHQIQFEKVIENKKIVVKEIRTVTSTKKKKVSRLVFQTMYKFKKPN